MVKYCKRQIEEEEEEETRNPVPGHSFYFEAYFSLQNHLLNLTKTYLKAKQN